MTGTSPYVLVSICAFSGGLIATRLFAGRLLGRFFPSNHPVDERDDRAAAYGCAFICGGALGAAVGYLIVLCI